MATVTAGCETINWPGGVALESAITSGASPVSGAANVACVKRGRDDAPGGRRKSAASGSL